MSELTPEMEAEWHRKATEALEEAGLWTAQKRSDAQRILTLLEALGSERLRVSQAESAHGELLSTQLSVIESRDATSTALSQLLENAGAELAREPAEGFATIDEYRVLTGNLRTLFAKHWESQK